MVAQEAKAVHITILTVGSRGDVQPYLALAAGLRQAGYQVRVATHRPFQAAVHQRGLEFRPVAGNPRELLESDCYGLREDPGWQSDEARAMLDHWERDARENLERHRKEQR